MSPETPRSLNAEPTLLSKSALVAKAIAVDVLALGLGEPLPPISDYAKRFAVGNGTVQTALGYLQQIGAVDLEPRGRLGTALRGRGLAQLWHVATGRPILGGLPIPYSRIFEGLSTGLRECFRREQLNLAFVHVDGSRERIRVLLEGETDFAVLSTLGAEMAIAEGAAIESVLSLGRGSFMHKHVVVMPKSARLAPERPRLVGIDPSSIEHAHISRLYCESLESHERFEFRETRSIDFAQALVNGDIDLIVWPADETLSLRPRDIRQERLPRSVLDALASRHREASVVVRSSDQAMRSLLTMVIRPELVRTAQAQVVRGLRVASY